MKKILALIIICLLAVNFTACEQNQIKNNESKLNNNDYSAKEFAFSNESLRFLYKGIIIKHNKTEPTYTKTSLFLCEKRRFFMARTEKGVVTTI